MRTIRPGSLVTVRTRATRTTTTGSLLHLRRRRLPTAAMARSTETRPTRTLRKKSSPRSEVVHGAKPIEDVRGDRAESVAVAKPKWTIRVGPVRTTTSATSAVRNRSARQKPWWLI
uniref:(northern house mosquito) hypothetical protein n=1 Tax=Culex pipiens TaxID=7175 RepID=A0A8D7ZVR0_CULPI